MVLAVDAGHHMNKAKVTFYMLLTIIGGAIFVGSQAWEWKNFIKGEYGALETRGGQILQFMDAETGKRVALEAFAANIDSLELHTKTVMESGFFQKHRCLVIVLKRLQQVLQQTKIWLLRAKKLMNWVTK